ncbi:serine hydrolase-like protein 2 isoform X2 [Ambystoma mexicanum]
MGTTVPHRSHPGVPTDFRIPVPWGHLAALSWGPVDGSPVICLHGWMDNANSFQRLVPLLPSDRRYIALDFSGHGHSSHLAKGSRYDFNNYMIEVCRAVQALNYCQVSIIGHSMGGIIGTMFACIFPDMVENLILLDVYGFFPNSPEHLIKQTRNVITNHLKLEHKHGPKVYSPEGALSRLLEANTALTEDSGRIILERGTKEVPGGVVFSRDIQVSMPYHPLFTMELSLAFLGNIGANVLTIMASESLSNRTGKDASERSLVNGFKSSLKEKYQLEIVEGNHFVHLNEPEMVSGLISSFLQEKSTSSGSIRSRL